MWEYQTWTTADTKAGRSIREINGESLAEYRPEYPALAEAGVQGWELVNVVGSGTKNSYTLYFKRQLSESADDAAQRSSVERQRDDAIAQAWSDQTALRQPEEESL